MVHYSGVSIVDFDQVNVGWDNSGSFRKNLEKSHSWPFKRLSPTYKFFKGDHWIVPELEQLVTQANHNKNLIFLMADIALRYTDKSFTQINPFHLALIHAYRWRYVSLKYINILFSLWTRIAHAFFGEIWVLIRLQSPKFIQNFWR